MVPQRPQNRLQHSRPFVSGLCNLYIVPSDPAGGNTPREFTFQSFSALQKRVWVAFLGAPSVLGQVGAAALDSNRPWERVLGQRNFKAARMRSSSVASGRVSANSAARRA